MGWRVFLLSPTPPGCNGPHDPAIRGKYRTVPAEFQLSSLEPDAIDVRHRTVEAVRSPGMERSCIFLAKLVDSNRIVDRGKPG